MEGLGHDAHRPHAWTMLERRRDLNAGDGTIVTADSSNSAFGSVAWHPRGVHKPTPYPAWAFVFEPVRSTGGEDGGVHAEKGDFAT